MNAGSIPAIVLAGIMFYVGLYHLLLYMRRVQQRLDLNFGLSCLAIGCYDIFCAGLYGASSPLEGLEWQRLQGMALIAAAVLFMWYVADYTALRSRRGVTLFSLFFIITFIPTVISRGPLFWRPDLPLVRSVNLPFGMHITYHEVTPGIMSVLQMFVAVAMFLYLFRVVKLYSDSGNRRRARPLFAAVLLFFAAFLNDGAVMMGMYPFVYLLEYAYFGIALIMAFSMTRTVGEAVAMKETLRVSEERFRAIFNNASAGIALVAPDGHFITANTAMCRVFGRTQENVGDATVFMRLHPDDVDATHERHRAILKGETEGYRAEKRYMRDDGSILWGDMSVTSIRRWDGCVDAMTAVMVDITERKQAEEALRKLNEQLEQKVIERTAELRESNIRLEASLKKLKEDEEAGRMIQFSMLPPEIRRIGRLEFSRYLSPSLYVSGDFLDYFEIDAEHTGFYMADVSGHGVSSAFVTVMLKSFMAIGRELHKTEGDATILNPDRLLAKLNGEMLEQNLDKYLTIFYGVLDRGGNRLVYCNGGQFPFPVLCGDGCASEVKGKGPPVGLFDFARYSKAECTLPDGYSVVLFSDGVLDVLPQESLEEKQKVLQDAVRQHGAALPALAAAFGIESRESLPDDVTMLAIRQV